MNSRTWLSKLVGLSLCLGRLLSDEAAGQTRQPEASGVQRPILGQESLPAASEGEESTAEAGRPSEGAVPRLIRFKSPFIRVGFSCQAKANLHPPAFYAEITLPLVDARP